MYVQKYFCSYEVNYKLKDNFKIIHVTMQSNNIYSNFKHSSKRNCFSWALNLCTLSQSLISVVSSFQYLGPSTEKLCDAKFLCCIRNNQVYMVQCTGSGNMCRLLIYWQIFKVSWSTIVQAFVYNTSSLNLLLWWIDSQFKSQRAPVALSYLCLPSATLAAQF